MLGIQVQAERSGAGSLRAEGCSSMLPLTHFSISCDEPSGERGSGRTRGLAHSRAAELRVTLGPTRLCATHGDGEVALAAGATTWSSPKTRTEHSASVQRVWGRFRTATQGNSTATSSLPLSPLSHTRWYSTHGRVRPSLLCACPVAGASMRAMGTRAPTRSLSERLRAHLVDRLARQPEARSARLDEAVPPAQLALHLRRECGRRRARTRVGAVHVLREPVRPEGRAPVGSGG